MNTLWLVPIVHSLLISSMSATSAESFLLEQLTSCYYYRCGLQLCGKCIQSQLKNHKQECDLFVTNKIKFDCDNEKEAIKSYSIITVLRALLSGKVDEFESHDEAREGTPIWMYVETVVVPVLTQATHGHTSYTADMIHRAAGVLDTNTFEMKTVNNVSITV